MSNNFPFIRVFEWDTTEVASPVGNRTAPGGTFAFKQIVSSGCSSSDINNPFNTSGVLLFEDVKFDLTETPLPSHVASKVTAITFNVASTGDAISDMRLFVSDDSAFQGSADQGLDRGFVQFATSGSLWQPNGLLPSGAADRLPLIVPADPNVFRQDGTAGLVAQDDENSSEFIYLNVVMPLGAPLGGYGVCGSGLLRLSLVFNYWDSSFFTSFGQLVYYYVRPIGLERSNNF